MVRLRVRLRWTSGAAAAVMLLAASAARADVTEYLGRPVASIRLVLDGRDTTEQALTRVVEVHVGEPLSMRDVRESVLHLFAMSRFDDVRVDASRQGAGIALRFDLIGARPVNAIR